MFYAAQAPQNRSNISSVSIQFNLLCFIIVEPTLLHIFSELGWVCVCVCCIFACSFLGSKESEGCVRFHFDWPNQQSMEICIFYHNSPAASARAPPHRSTHIVFYISILHSEIRTHSPTHRFRACRGDRMENSLFLIQFSLLETKLIIIAYYVHCMRNTLNFLAHTHTHTGTQLTMERLGLSRWNIRPYYSWYFFGVCFFYPVLIALAIIRFVSTT